LAAIGGLADGADLIKGSTDGRIYNVDTSVPGESVRWTTTPIDFGITGLAVDSDNDIMYASGGASWGQITAFDLTTGAEIAPSRTATGYIDVYGLEFVRIFDEDRLFSIGAKGGESYLIEYKLDESGMLWSGNFIESESKILVNGSSSVGYAGLAWHEERAKFYSNGPNNQFTEISMDGTGTVLFGLGLSATSGLGFQDGVLYGISGGSPTSLVYFDLDNSPHQIQVANNTQVTNGWALTSTTTPGEGNLKILTETLPDGNVDIAYEETLQAMGGTRPYSWSVASGNLPDGLILTSATGVISGTPTTMNTYMFTVQVMDDLSATSQKELSITVASFRITTESLPTGYKDTAYSVVLAADGGVEPYSWSLSAGSLPTGLSLNGSTGEISGTPTAIENQTFTVRVDDSSTKWAQKEFTLSVVEPPPPVLLYGTNHGTANLYDINASTPDLWSETLLFTTPGFGATGAAVDSDNGVIYLSGSGSAWNDVSKWDVSTGSMLWSVAYRIRVGAVDYEGCYGLEFVNDTLYGVGTRYDDSAGGNRAFLFTIDVDTDIGDATEIGRIGNFGVAAGLAFVPETGLFYTTDSASWFYSVDPNSVEENIGTLIAGLAKYHAHGLAYQNGQIGTGTTGKLMGLSSGSGAGSIYEFDWETGAQADAVGVSSCSYGLSGQATPSMMAIPPAELPDASKGDPYSSTIEQNGGVAPITWTISDGALPASLTLNASTGEISGTVTADEGSYSFLVYAQDSLTNEDDQWFTIDVTVDVIDIKTVSVHNGKIGSYQDSVFQKIAGDGSTPTWSQESGGIPTGLGLSQVDDTYVLSGNPTTEGVYTFSIKVSDSTGSTMYGYTVEIKDYSPWTLAADDPCLFAYGDAISPPPELTPMKRWLVAAASGNGKFYTIGGATDADWDNGGPVYAWNRQSTLGIYDPTADTWDAAFWKPWPSTVEYPVNGAPTGYNNGNGTSKPVIDNGTGYCHGQACSYDVDTDGTDEIFVFGGYPIWDSKGHIYDPDTNSWSTTKAPSDDGLSMSGFRRGAVVNDGANMYLLGGTGNVSLAALVRYNADTDTWTQLTDSPVSWENHTAAIVGGKIYAFGGSEGMSNVYSYDIAGNTWSGPLASIPTGVMVTSSAVRADKIVLLGGETAGDGITDLIQIYDITADTWDSSAIALPMPLRGLAAAVVGDELIIADGNLSGAGTDLTNSAFRILIDDLLGVGAPPEITNIARVPSGIEITWTTEMGVTYAVESSSDPADFSAAVTEATGLSGPTWTDTNTAGVTEKYYRVKVE
jgi:hypothetical protein